MRARRAITFSALLLVATVLGACGQDMQNGSGASADFAKLDSDVSQMQSSGIIYVEKRKVLFNKNAALTAGYPQASIELAAELTRHSNEVVDESREAAKTGTDDLSVLNAGTGNYPAVEAFYKAATDNLNNTEAPGSLEPQAVRQAVTVCGGYSNPLPRRGGPRRYASSSDPAASLRKLGYHPTPGLAGGGWTLPKTYRPEWCFLNTYRWHGSVSSNRITEQYYYGSPPGEPNPEVYRTSWPYPLWPAYVRWWHQNF